MFIYSEVYVWGMLSEEKRLWNRSLQQRQERKATEANGGRKEGGRRGLPFCSVCSLSHTVASLQHSRSRTFSPLCSICSRVEVSPTAAAFTLYLIVSFLQNLLSRTRLPLRSSYTVASLQHSLSRARSPLCSNRSCAAVSSTAAAFALSHALASLQHLLSRRGLSRGRCSCSLSHSLLL